MADSPNTDSAEIWKPVPGLEGFYSASNLGRIYRHERTVNARSGGKRVWCGEIMVGHVGMRGYRKVKVFRRDKEVHRLVCLAFHGEPPSPKHHAAHWNDIKTDNRPENLRWATAQENAVDRLRNGLQARGEDIAAGKLTAADVLAIRAEHKGKYGDGARLARLYGVRQENIIAIVKRRAWTHI